MPLFPLYEKCISTYTRTYVSVSASFFFWLVFRDYYIKIFLKKIILLVFFFVEYLSLKQKKYTEKKSVSNYFFCNSFFSFFKH